MQGVTFPNLRRLAIRPAVIFLLLLTLLPVGFILARLTQSTRDIAYWDEFDTALSFVLQLDKGMGAGELFHRLFQVSNEHRMVTSRLMFAASYWLTGTVDFAVISWIGNASLFALCALLIWSARTPLRRLRLAFVLAMLLFQLEHYENFLWSGSSIDHFQVVLLAGGAIVGLAVGTPVGFVIGAICAGLATFTLAHGIVVWPVGAAILVSAKRWRDLAAWCGVAAIAIGGFLAGFHLNTGERFAEPTLHGLWVVGGYWLGTLGSVPALGNLALAPWLGGVLILSLVAAGVRGGLRREPVAFSLACYAVGALALIAVGRAAEAEGVIHSRYYVLAALAWGMAIFIWLEWLSPAERPLAVLWGCVPALAAFNLAANYYFRPKAESWIECRDRAAVRFQQYGTDGRGPFALYPAPEHATRLLAEADQRGVYRMAPVCQEIQFPPSTNVSSRISYFVEEITVDGRAAGVAGWAAIPGLPSRRGQLHLVLRSPDETHVFTTVAVTRPDVAEALHHPECVLSGFRFALLRDSLPTGDFQIGFLIKDGSHSEYVMTAHRMLLVGEGKAVIATAD